MNVQTTIDVPSTDRFLGPCNVWVPQLGHRVKFAECDDIKGIITATIKYLDGSIRYRVDYWINGERKDVSCEARELVLID